MQQQVSLHAVVGLIYTRWWAFLHAVVGLFSSMRTHIYLDMQQQVSVHAIVGLFYTRWWAFLHAVVGLCYLLAPWHYFHLTSVFPNQSPPVLRIFFCVWLIKTNQMTRRLFDQLLTTFGIRYYSTLTLRGSTQGTTAYCLKAATHTQKNLVLSTQLTSYS